MDFWDSSWGGGILSLFLKQWFWRSSKTQYIVLLFIPSIKSIHLNICYHKIWPFWQSYFKFTLSILAIILAIRTTKVLLENNKINITISTGIPWATSLKTMITMRSKYYTETLPRKSGLTLSLHLICSTLKTKLCRANIQRMILGLSIWKLSGAQVVGGRSEAWTAYHKDTKQVSLCLKQSPDILCPSQSISSLYLRASCLHKWQRKIGISLFCYRVAPIPISDAFVL